MRRIHWFGEDVHRITTTLDELPKLLPVFDRYGLGRNRFRDVIVRRDDGQLPVATVSKRYVLVQHADAVAAVTGEVRKAGIDPAGVPARLLISEYGTRVAIRTVLPDEYAFTGDDGERVGLTFELFNSVDRTVPLMAAVGWLRFVCSNGLVIGETTARIRQRHSPALDIDEISMVLAEGTRTAITDRQRMFTWQRSQVDESDLVEWVNEAVAAQWGPAAAARVYGIAKTGRDGTPSLRPRRAHPHQRRLTATVPVPGTCTPCADAYAIAQVLSWVASRRGNIAERLRWRAQIPALMETLMEAAA